MKDYRAPRWLAGHGTWGGNAQTIFPALYSRAWPQHPRAHTRVAYRRERWPTPDADFIDVDFLDAAPVLGRTPGHEPLLVLFHGLEGSSQSHYARAFALWAHSQGWSCALPHFRGCSGELNLAPRTYHSGDHPEIDWILRRLAARHAGPLLAVGVSLGGNVLMRWAQEQGSDAARVVKAAVAISSPLDLAAAGQTLGRGFNRLIYTYDAVFTAPLHGFASTEDYWARCSAKPGLKAMRDVPVLLLNALNDPFMPAASLPTRADVGPAVTLWQPAEGGHVGFPAGRFPGHVADLPQAVGRWLHQHL